MNFLVKVGCHKVDEFFPLCCHYHTSYKYAKVGSNEVNEFIKVGCREVNEFNKVGCQAVNEFNRGVIIEWG